MRAPVVWLGTCLYSLLAADAATAAAVVRQRPSRPAAVGAASELDRAVAAAAAAADRGDFAAGCGALEGQRALQLPARSRHTVERALGKCRYQQGDYGRAAALLAPETARALRSAGAEPGDAETLRTAGDLALAQLDPSAAQRLLAAARRAAGRASEPATELLSRIDLARLAVFQGEERQATAMLAEIVEAAAAAREPRTELKAMEEAAFLATRRGELRLARQVIDRGLRRAEESGEAAAEGRLLTKLAEVERMTTGLPQALQLAARALSLARRARDLLGEAASLREAGAIELQRENYTAAVARYGAALAIANAAAQPATAAQAAVDLLSCNQRGGDADPVLVALDHQMATLRVLGQEAGAALVEDTSAKNLLALGRPREAATVAAKSVAYFTAHAHGYAQALSTITLANARALRDGTEVATHLLDGPLTYFTRTGDRLDLALVHNAIANLRYSAGRYDQARREYESALTLYSHMGARASVATSWNNLGNLADGVGSYSVGLADLQRSTAIRSAMGFHLPLTATNLADCLRKMARYDQARQAYLEELRLAQASGDHTAAGDCLEGLGGIASDERQWVEALRHYDDALRLRQSEHKVERALGVQRKIAYVRLEKGDRAEALRGFQEATAGCPPDGGTACVAEGLTGQGDAYLAWGFRDHAEDAYRKALARLAREAFPSQRSNVVKKLADCLNQKGEDDAALELYRDELKWQTAQKSSQLVASTMIEISRILRDRTGGLAEAHRLTKAALRIREGLGNPRWIAASLDDLGTWEEDAKHYEKAMRTYLREQQFDRAGGDELGESITLYHLGKTQSLTGHCRNALATLREANRIRKSWHLEPDHDFLVAYGDSLHQCGHYDESIQVLTIAQQLARTRDELVDALTELGRAQQDADRYGAALASYTSAINLAANSNDQANAYNARADLYRVLHQVPEALQDLRSDLNLTLKMNDPGSLATTYDDFAWVYRENGAANEARHYNEQAVKIALHGVPDPIDIGNYLCSLAATQLEQNQPEQAIVSVRRGLRLAQANPRPLVNLYQEEGRILQRYPRLGNARAAYQQALDLAAANGDDERTAEIDSNLGDLAEVTGDTAGAALWYGKALKRASDNNDKEQESAAEYHLGKLAEAMNHPVAASDHYAKAIDLREQLRSENGQEDFRISVAGLMATTMRRAIDLFLERGEVLRAFDLLERVRARSLLDQVAGARLTYSGDDPRGYILRLHTQLQSVEKRLETESAPADLAALETQRSALITAFDGALDRAAEKRPGAAIAALRPVPDLLARMPAGVTLLVYYLGNREAAVFRLHSGRFDAIRLAHPDKIRAAVKRANAWGTESAAAKKRQLRKVYDLLIAPAAPPGTLLGIVPHDVLQGLPFAALWDGEQFLSQRFALFELPAANILPVLRRTPSRPGVVLALAQAQAPNQPFLRTANREVGDITKAFRRGARPVVDADVAALLRWLPAAQVLHIAAHAHRDPDNPWNSAIFLRDKLPLLRLKQLRTPNLDLVVLSACETQGGVMNAADEATSLDRVFLAAGARAVLASLWKVPDDLAHDLMVAFYDQLQGGRGAAAALAAAQMEMRQQHPEEPFAWASFVLSGDPGPIRLPPARWPLGRLAALGLAALLAIGALGYLVHRRVRLRR
jgi:CHAT domain-containing protein